MTEHRAACDRHGFGFAPSDDPRQPYYVTRCMHIGNRFVVEIRSSVSWFVTVDYVEDLPNDDVIVEATDPRDEESVQQCWDDLTAKMKAHIPPNPEAES